VLTAVQYRILKRISPAAPTHLSGGAYQGKSKIQVLLGPDIFTEISGKTVIDFGCGNGVDAIEIAKHGASRVIGIDIREELLLHARRLATAEGVICEFVTRTDEKADVIISLDSFEHFDDPAATLLLMTELLASNGRAAAKTQNSTGTEDARMLSRQRTGQSRLNRHASAALCLSNEVR